jgi:hypothetical protein
MKQGLKCAALLWFHVLGIFQQSYNSPMSKLSDVLLFCDCFLLWLMFFNSPTQFPPISGIEWCAALLWLPVLEYFQQSYPIPKSRDWVMCCSFVTCVRVYFFKSTIPTYEAGIEWCAALLWFHVFELFFNSPTQFPPMKQGLSDVLLFVIPRVRVFSTVLPNSTYGRDWSDVLLFCDYTSSIFQSAIPPIKQGLSDVLLFCDYMC